MLSVNVQLAVADTVFMMVKVQFCLRCCYSVLMSCEQHYRQQVAIVDNHAFHTCTVALHISGSYLGGRYV